MADVQQVVSLALETSSRRGEVALGRGDTLLGVRDIPVPPRGREHRVDLMVAVDALCREHEVTPDQVREVYVSVGPGSFTGLRNAVTTAKMLAMTLGSRIVAVPTTDVLIANAPTDRRHVAVCVNTKRDSVYAARYTRRDDRWQLDIPAGTQPIAELLLEAPRPLALLGDEHLPPVALPADVERLDPALAQPQAATVWRVGRALAQQGRFTDPLNLLPLYARQPEAVELWERARKPPMNTDQHR